MTPTWLHEWEADQKAVYTFRPLLLLPPVCVCVHASRIDVSMVTDWVRVCIPANGVIDACMTQILSFRCGLFSTSKATKEMWHRQSICLRCQTCPTTEQKKKKNTWRKDKISRFQVKMSGTHSLSPVYAAALKQNPDKALCLRLKVCLSVCACVIYYSCHYCCLWAIK